VFWAQDSAQRRKLCLCQKTVIRWNQQIQGYGQILAGNGHFHRLPENELVLLRPKQVRVRRVALQNFVLTHDPIFHFINPQQPKLSGLCALPLRTSVWGSSNKALCPPRAGSPVTLAPWSFQSPSPLKAQTVAAAPCAFLPPADCLRSSASPSVDFFLISWSPSAREHES
jgi:hypothetical protein